MQFITPKLASHLGISFIHQELNLINDLKVYENLFLGKEIKNKFGFLKVNEMIKKTKDVLNLLNVDIDAEYYVRDLDISSKQIVEIAKAILYEAKLIIMDEPTTSLTDIEIKNLFKIMIALKNKGVSIIFISHKLKEVFEICDSYTVLKDGLVTGFGDIKCIDENLITKLMVGKEISEKIFYPGAIHGNSFRGKNLSCKKFYKNINFKLLRGNIRIYWAFR
ncbi:ATP-binding cassette domain-containing protein [Caloramator sp. Dgby_cultured_2]|uniref:ATP-binding cassette domain-containing protein n=1 Tax=Caloramator sp. Dgby_cultured_2 TaxID=3029174 RepID=UPI00315939A4